MTGIKGTCSACALIKPGLRERGNHLGPGCATEVDGVHPLGWGQQGEDEEPERDERGMILCKPCYYLKKKAGRFKKDKPVG